MSEDSVIKDLLYLQEKILKACGVPKSIVESVLEESKKNYASSLKEGYRFKRTCELLFDNNIIVKNE